MEQKVDFDVERLSKSKVEQIIKNGVLHLMFVSGPPLYEIPKRSLCFRYLSSLEIS